MKASVLIAGQEQELILSKTVSVKEGKALLHLTQLSNNTWELVYNTNVFPTIESVNNVLICGLNEGIPSPLRDVGMFINGEEKKISKIHPATISHQCLHIDQTHLGSLHLFYSTKLIPNISKVKGLSVIRKD